MRNKYVSRVESWPNRVGSKDVKRPAVSQAAGRKHQGTASACESVGDHGAALSSRKKPSLRGRGGGALQTHVAPTKEMLASGQRLLGVTIPQQHVEFLDEYGHGSVGGVEILGVGLTGTMLFLEAALRHREYGLPNNLLVIENCDEWQECIDCDTGEVVSWDPVEGAIVDYSDFDVFLLDRTQDANENL